MAESSSLNSSCCPYTLSTVLGGHFHWFPSCIKVQPKFHLIGNDKSALNVIIGFQYKMLARATTTITILRVSTSQHSCCTRARAVTARPAVG